jgi:hypothetical protein
VLELKKEMAKHKLLVKVLREKIDQNLEDICTDNRQVGIIVNRMGDIYRYTFPSPSLRTGIEE